MLESIIDAHMPHILRYLTIDFVKIYIRHLFLQNPSH